MKRTIIACAALTMLGAGTAMAQTSAQTQTGTSDALLSPSDWNALRDARVGVIKAALQLRPDQQQYWPAVESAIRARSESRERRIAALRQRMGEAKDFDPVQLMKTRAEGLAQRADNLKKLADAWQPLYATLDQDQKRRMRVLAVLSVREMREAIDSRLMMHDDDEDDASEY